jgi:hypothetical protein
MITSEGRSSSGGSFIGPAIVVLAIWLLFFGGLQAVQRATQGYATSGAPIVSTIQEGARRIIAPPVVSAPAAPSVATLPTAVVAKPTVQPNVQVVPQGQFHAEPTAVPSTAVPAPVSAEVQAVYNSLHVKTTAIPLAACEGGAETYITTSVKVLDMRGFPIGEVRGRSCVSDQDAHDNATKMSQEMMDKDKIAHPDAWK